LSLLTICNHEQNNNFLSSNTPFPAFPQGGRRIK
jgi:hypothetical protein